MCIKNNIKECIKKCIKTYQICISGALNHQLRIELFINTCIK